MPLSRLLILVVGLILILGLAIWLIDSLTRLYWQLAYYPLLSQALLFLIIVLIGVLIAAFIYYFFWLPQQSKKKAARRTQPKIPVAKTEAAEETLKAIRRQVAQIQDEVARQELLSRSHEIEQNLSRRELQVVIFGTGSAGKTSIANALIGRMVGEVGAPMGTTEVGETYSLRLKGLNREILIIDTPGILEAGVAGTERERLARKLATEADLLLFVLDNDLRKSEYDPLQALAEIGKRSLVILNKSDLYTEDDRETILARLRERVRGLVGASDVVAVAARPNSVILENGESFYPDPDIMPLIRRMVAVLRAEGEDLVADNILLQSQRLGEEARKLIDLQRRRQAEKIVERFQWIGAGVVAATPLPVVDLLAAAAVNAQMVVEIGRVYGCDINPERGRELALSLGKTLASLGIVKGAVTIVSTALQVSVGGMLVGRAIQGVSAAYLTRIAGRSFIEYFRHDQDWGDGGITEVVQRQFQLNRKDEFIRSFVQEAITRVVKPLNLDRETELEAEELELESQPMVELRARLERDLEPVELEADDWERPKNYQIDDWEERR
ncbi:GTP-binding protein [Kovacikia minuta CCNUW1]|uniref:GTP-binding protein n=1 Tax=Kovacikia minuta TaxID=2931930 RepID=UPI001CC8FDF8|nr:GTP-binding protein [Kovacikia minuta]UBF28406.1 GTP-binding protein [Kovacikia minuta CCNUW1]